MATASFNTDSTQIQHRFNTDTSLTMATASFNTDSPNTCHVRKGKMRMGTGACEPARPASIMDARSLPYLEAGNGGMQVGPRGMQARPRGMQAGPRGMQARPRGYQRSKEGCIAMEVPLLVGNMQLLHGTTVHPLRSQWQTDPRWPRAL